MKLTPEVHVKKGLLCVRLPSGPHSDNSVTISALATPWERVEAFLRGGGATPEQMKFAKEWHRKELAEVARAAR